MFKTAKIHPLKIFNIRIGKYVFINIWFIPVLLFSITGGYAGIFLITYAIALIHELSHILCARILNVPVSGITVYPFGIAAKLRSGYIQSSFKEFIIAFAGPFSNIICFWICCIIKVFLNADINTDMLIYCADVNLAMCAVNMIPSLPLDGGRMLKSILTSHCGIIRAYNFMIRLSRAAIILLLAAAAALFFISGFNFSLILISAFLLQNLCSEQEAITVITLKEILNSKNKLNSDILPVKALCTDGNHPARGLLRYLTYDYYYIVHITDKNSVIIKTLTETQVLSALTENGIRVRYKDV